MKVGRWNSKLHQNSKLNSGLKMSLKVSFHDHNEKNRGTEATKPKGNQLCTATLISLSLC